MTMIPEVPFSELINRPKATTAKLAESRAHELRLRRRGDVDLVLRDADADREHNALVSAAVRFLRALVSGGQEKRRMALEVAPEVFPWMRFLPEQDAEMFLAELAELLHAIEELETNAPVLTLVTQWKHTAEVYADPETLEALTRERDPDADFGPVPPPGGWDES
ncbi:hypothetical protein MRI28_09415 [Nocardiopsis dassonvillei]|uniref:hypothetical protein n=1 Tax=Nocardiopsis dassonvillei TaxID=2014 RepID=UPI00200C29BE|nr:hypothetical protein [Nocardiopsis dassonvillei]MCK9869865.1 hypothetical protein [Nocardiopsis dassonvillei]